MSRYVPRMHARFLQHAAGSVAALLLLCSALWATAASGGIGKSKHDFSEASWNIIGKGAKDDTENGICSVCHQAHNIAPPIVPLWSHETSKGPFTPYKSPTMVAEVGQPDGASLACLSCHDGTVAVNQVTGKQLSAADAAQIPPESLVPPDLHTVHPVSFVYDATLAARNGSLEDPTTYRIGDAKSDLTVNVAPVPGAWEGARLHGKTIDDALLFEHKLECSSCHDVHNQDGNAPENGVQLRIDGFDSTGRNDLLCRTCHVK